MILATLANSGAPLLGATAAHLLVGCGIIAAIEALIVWGRFKTSFARAFAAGLVANYLSGWLGMMSLHLIGWGLYEAFWPGTPLIRAAWPILWICVLVALIMSIVIEWPLWAVSLKPGAGSWRGLKASCLVHAVTYPLLVLWYAGVSSSTMYTSLSQDDSLSWVPRDLGGWVYYIGVDDENLWRIRLDGRHRERVATIPRTGRYGVRILPKRDPAGNWEIVTYTMYERDPKPEDQVTLLSDLPGRSGEPRINEATIPHGGDLQEHIVRGTCVFDLQEDSLPTWSLGMSWYRAGEMSLVNLVNGETTPISFDNPVFHLAFTGYSPSILPRDLIVFHVGRWGNGDIHDTMLVLDGRRRILGVLGPGRWPVVVLDDAPE